MPIPKSTRGVLKLLIRIAETGNAYTDKRLSDSDELMIGGLMADIQNNLGEMKSVLDKLNLYYDSTIH